MLHTIFNLNALQDQFLIVLYIPEFQGYEMECVIEMDWVKKNTEVILYFFLTFLCVYLDISFWFIA